MYRMMNDMGPRGRRMHHRGSHPLEIGLFLIPTLLFGAFFGFYIIFAVLNVTGVVIGTVASGLGYALAGIVSGLGSVFSWITDSLSSAFHGGISMDGVAVGIALGLIWYFRMKKNRNKENTEN